MSNYKNDRFVDLIKQAFPLVAEKFGRESDTGGFVYIADHNGVLHCHLRIAHPHPEKWTRFVFFSQEKVERLVRHPDHQFSGQSRDDEQEHFAGAVIGPEKMYYSFSGLPQDTDEALVLAAMVKAEIITYAYAVLCLDVYKDQNPGKTEHFIEVHKLFQKIV